MTRDSAHLEVIAGGSASAQWPELSDDDLMLLVRNDQRAAFEALAMRHHEMVLGYACRFLGSRELAREVTQEVFLVVWRERSHYRAQGRFVSYLLKLTFNRCQGAARGHKRHLAKLARFAASGVQASTGGTPLEEMLEAARAEQVHAELAKLPEGMRQALILRYLNGLSTREIADATNMPAGTIKSNICRGLRKLYAALGGETA